MLIIDNDALPLEYKLKYWSARRYVKISDLMRGPHRLHIIEAACEKKPMRFLGINVHLSVDTGTAT